MRGGEGVLATHWWFGGHCLVEGGLEAALQVDWRRGVVVGVETSRIGGGEGGGGGCDGQRRVAAAAGVATGGVCVVQIKNG